MSMDLSLVSTKELLCEIADRCDNIVILRETTLEQKDSYEMSKMKYYWRLNEDFVEQCHEGDGDKAIATMLSKALYDILRGNALEGDDEVDKFKIEPPT